MHFNLFLLAVIAFCPYFIDAFLINSEWVTMSNIPRCLQLNSFGYRATKPKYSKTTFFINRSNGMQSQYASTTSEQQGKDVDNIMSLKWNICRLLEHIGDDSSNATNLLFELYRHAGIAVDNSESGENHTSEIKEQELPLPLVSMRRFLRSSNHEGCFKIFHNSSVASTMSLPPALLFSMDQPLTFVQEELSYPRSNGDSKKGMLHDKSEAVICCVSKEHHLEYTSRFLDNMPLAQLCMGYFSDCKVAIDREILFKLQSLGILERDTTWSLESKDIIQCKVLSNDLDVIGNILSSYISLQNQEEPEFQRESQSTLIKWIDYAVDSTRKCMLGTSDEPHLVIITHSTHALVVASAISSWKQQKLQNSTYKKLHVEDLLHEAVTVVTIGATCQQFCDGPAYIHISMYDDVLAQRFGPSEKNASGGGRNAVYFHTWSPFNEVKGELKYLSDNDTHNMNACSIQFLYLVMRINGITSFRGLYNSAKFVDPHEILDISPRNFAIDYTRHKLGDLVIPPNIDDELLPAMIHATGAEKLFWNEGGGALPDDEESKCYLEEYFGYNAFEEIREIVSGQIAS